MKKIALILAILMAFAVTPAVAQEIEWIDQPWGDYRVDKTKGVIFIARTNVPMMTELLGIYGQLIDIKGKVGVDTSESPTPLGSTLYGRLMLLRTTGGVLKVSVAVLRHATVSVQWDSRHDEGVMIGDILAVFNDVLKADSD